MAITEVNVRDFPKDLKALLDQVDAGVTIVLCRGNSRRYTLLPVRDEDLDFTPEMHASIKKAMEDIKRGEGTRVKGVSGVRDFFSSL